MELLEHLSLGFSIAALPENLLYCFLGVILGTAVGVLPGLGPLATMAMLLPLTFTLPITSSLIMMAGIYYGSQYGGSTTAILINLPGESSSAVTTIDGYQMARRGRAGPALVAAAAGSFFAGTVATVLIAMVAQPLTTVALQFGSAEYFSLMVLGLTSSIALASGSILKAVAMICVGLMLGLVGTDIYSGEERFTMGVLDLADGIDFVAIAVGLFGIGEILRNLEDRKNGKVDTIAPGKLWPSREDMKRMVAPILRGTVVGSILGVLPGGGALLSSFVAYNVEKNVSKNKHELGKGAIEGVAGPEAANNAGAQVSFIPMLSLGIPSNVIMAIMVGAMTMQGITPGPNVINNNPEIFWALIASMWIGNAMLVILNLPLVGIWVSLLRIPYQILFPIIIAVSCIGVYSVGNSTFSVFLALAAGLVGYLLSKLECEPAPLVLGFILGPMLEEHLRRALIISDGDVSVFFTQPISGALLLTALGVLAVVSRPVMARQRKSIFVEE